MTMSNNTPNSALHTDVMIVGAGLSGIGAAVHLQTKCPGRNYMLIERRDAIGGTWDLFKYPGIRSDSDMHTLGYNFKPWRAKKAIADGPAIWDYVNETADEYGIREKTQFGHKLIDAAWSSESATWLLTVETSEETRYFSCNFLLMCAGYYNYDAGHQPDFDGRESFQGQWIHPQFWPDDLDYAGKKVVVIGSGATAMTLVPNMALKAEKVTMVQRSPTYVVSRPSVDVFANFLRYVLPAKWAYSLVRFKNTLWQQLIYNQTRTNPDRVAENLLGEVEKAVGDVVDVKKHFTPTYNPWDQRLCLVPDDDLFTALRTGKAEVVTDTVSHIDATGLVTGSGERIEADVIVSATGIELLNLGGAEFAVDSKPVNFADEWTYKGVMCSNIPNMVQTFGYINASWTLRADLTAEWVCRVLNHMEEFGYDQATPRIPDLLAKTMEKRFWIHDFSAGYMQRMMPKLPRQGTQMPWVNPQNFRKDKKMFRDGAVADGALIFTERNAEAESFKQAS
jgi:monooxygenase